MKLKPYPKYKDSGIQWIGQIPEEWYVDRLKFLVSKINSGITPKGGSAVYTNEGIPLLRSQNVHFDGLKLDDVAYIPEEIHQTMLNSVVKKHDVLINITGASIGRCTHVEEEFDKANVNQHVCIIRTKDIIHKYLSYYLRSRLGQDQVFSVQMGTSREGLNFDQLGNFIIFYPNNEAQQRIVQYLDKQTSKIDKTIQKDKQLIELLKEKRTALINHAVTKGLDPYATMKNVNLLSSRKTPEIWEIIRIKFVSKFSRGFDLSNDEFEEGNIPVYGSNGIIGYHNTSTCNGPSVTIGRSGSVGEVNYINDEKYWAHNTSLYLQESHGNDVRFIYYLLSTLDLKHLAAGSAVGTLNRNYVHDIYISLPPKSEQNKIVQYLDKQTLKIDKTIQKIEKKIEILEEYKKSIIHNVVVGKIDVRSVAA